MNAANPTSDSPSTEKLEEGMKIDDEKDGGKEHVPQTGKKEELDAAAALTSLGDSSDAPKPVPVEKLDPKPFEFPEKYTKSGRRKATPFPYKLMKLLSSQKHTDIIRWCKNGKSFSILRPRIFTKKLLPVHFKEAKFSSFTRKLHRWGFQRRLHGEDTGAFYHKDFIRNRVALLEKMTCHNQKPSSSSAYTSPTQTDSLRLDEKIQALVPNEETRISASALDRAFAASALNKSLRSTALDSIGTGSGSSAMPSLGGLLSAGDGLLTSSMREASRRNVIENDAMDLAIELEISRRLRRVTAASMTRQALAEMEARQAQAQSLQRQLELRRAAITLNTETSSLAARLASSQLPLGGTTGATLSAGSLGLGGICASTNSDDLLGLNRVAASTQGSRRLGLETDVRLASIREEIVLKNAVAALGNTPPNDIRNLKSMLR